MASGSKETEVVNNMIETIDPQENIHVTETDDICMEECLRGEFAGFYNGFNVEILVEEHKSKLYKVGSFGKGTISRSSVNSLKPSLQILRERQYIKRNNLYDKFKDKPKSTELKEFLNEVRSLTSEIKGNINIDFESSDEESDSSEENVIVVPNSSSDDEDYIKNLKPKLCSNKVKLKDKLYLSPQEAYYLVYQLNCLEIYENDQLLSKEECWDLFTGADRNFIEKYIVYHYYRCKGYVVKTGIKFGGDYLLYRGKPSEVHAKFIVVIKYKDEGYKLSWISVLAHIRTATTTVKEVIVAEVVEDNSKANKNPLDLSKYSVREVLLTRTPEQNKDSD